MPYNCESLVSNQNSYKISVSNRKERVGGAIALTCRSGISMRQTLNGVTRSFEYGVWQLIFKSITINCVGIYRPPSLATDNQFVSDIFLLLEEIVPMSSNLMVMGDFNLHIQDDSNTIEEFNNSLDALGLVQHVSFPTHVHGQSLDLVITGREWY